MASTSDTQVLKGKWRKLTTSKEFAGQWGVELTNGDGYADLSGQDVEIVRGSDGAVSRKRLRKLVSRRKGRLRPLYAIESIQKEES